MGFWGSENPSSEMLLAAEAAAISFLQALSVHLTQCSSLQKYDWVLIASLWYLQSPPTPPPRFHTNGDGGTEYKPLAGHHKGMHGSTRLQVQVSLQAPRFWLTGSQAMSAWGDLLVEYTLPVSRGCCQDTEKHFEDLRYCTSIKRHYNYYHWVI